MFSATLPRSLADFAAAGLSNPQLVRLDAERKLSPDLGLAFFTGEALRNTLRPVVHNLPCCSLQHLFEREVGNMLRYTKLAVHGPSCNDRQQLYVLHFPFQMTTCVL
jgi:hypothetical protein